LGTRRQWARDFAAALGNTTPSASLLSWISAWAAKENSHATYNPLNTTYDLPPNTNYNSVGVKNYTTRNQGIEATVRTLRGNHTGYADIVKGIVQNDPQTAANGLLVAPWGTNGAAVMALWKTTDVGDGMLPNEPTTETVHQSASTPTPPLHSGHGDVPTGGTDLESGHLRGSAGEADLEEGSLSTGKRTLYVVGGGFLVLVAGILAIKTYVPITQVVKTVAAVA
jgi:hypothetical protein